MSLELMDAVNIYDGFDPELFGRPDNIIGQLLFWSALGSRMLELLTTFGAFTVLIISIDDKLSTKFCNG
jgi:hypothetical protein